MGIVECFDYNERIFRRGVPLRRRSQGRVIRRRNFRGCTKVGRFGQEVLEIGSLCWGWWRYGGRIFCTWKGGLRIGLLSSQDKQGEQDQADIPLPGTRFQAFGQELAAGAPQLEWPIVSHMLDSKTKWDTGKLRNRIW